MYCTSCGTTLPDSSKFCPKCGKALGETVGTQYQTTMPLIGAGVGIRAVATIVDGLIFLPIAWLLAFIAGTTVSSGFTLEGPIFWFNIIIGFAYVIFFEGKLGATPGKMIVGLKVIKADGSACDITAAAIRTVCRIVDGLMGYFVGALFIWFSARNQRLGDRAAGTLVVRSAYLRFSDNFKQ